MLKNESDKIVELFRIYGPGMKKKAFIILKDNGLAEDAVQSAFMTLMDHMENIGEIDSSETKHYLYTIVVNNCYSILRKNKKYNMMDDDTIQANYADKLIQRDESLDGIAFEEIFQEVKQIPETYSNILILNGVYSYTQQEISSMLNIAPDVLRKRLQRARKLLKKIIASKGYEK